MPGEVDDLFDDLFEDAMPAAAAATWARHDGHSGNTTANKTEGIIDDLLGLVIPSFFLSTLLCLRRNAD